jgi:hypothetical protein
MNQDIRFGLANEHRVLPIIQQHFNDETIKKIPEIYSKIDYMGENYVFELKTRRNRMNQYPTTMLPLHKILKPEHLDNKTQIFLFDFTDGLYYIKYNKELFDKFDIKIGGRYDRGRVEENDYIYIPISELCKI